MTTGYRPLLVLGVLTLVLAVGLEALSPTPTLFASSQEGQVQAQGDTIELVFEREVFNYPAYERRNPFRPLTDQDDAGPRFEDLRLIGVILSSEPTESVAMLAVAAGRTYRVRVGEVLGTIRVLEIRLQEVLLEVEEFGVAETRVLRLQRAQMESSPQDAPPGGGVQTDTVADTIQTTPPPDTLGAGADPGVLTGEIGNGGTS